MSQKQRLIYFFVIILTAVLLSSCGNETSTRNNPPPATKPNSYDGKWFANFSTTVCDKSTDSSIALKLIKTENKIRGTVVFTYGGLVTRGRLDAELSDAGASGEIWLYFEDALFGFNTKLSLEGSQLNLKFQEKVPTQCNSDKESILNATTTLAHGIPASVLFDDELEPNFSEKIAAPIPLNRNNELVSIGSDIDWYTFELLNDSIVSVNFDTDLNLNFSTELYDEKLNLIISETIWTDQTKASLKTSIPAGRYFIKSMGGDSNGSVYHLNIQTVDVPDKNLEPNNELTSASNIPVNTSIEAYLLTNDQDWYKFELTQEAIVTFSLKVIQDTPNYYNDFPDFQLQNNQGTTIEVDFEELEGNSEIIEGLKVLAAGTYYLTLKRRETTIYRVGPYTLTLSSQELENDTLEPNNSKENATQLVFDSVQSLILTPEDIDWFKFSITKPTAVELNFQNEPDKVRYQFYQVNSPNPSPFGQFNSYLVFPTGDYFMKVDAKPNPFIYEIDLSSRPYSVLLKPVQELELDKFEPNNDPNGNDAVPIQLEQLYSDLTMYQWDIDVFEFTVPAGYSYPNYFNVLIDINFSGWGSITPGISKKGSRSLEHFSSDKYGNVTYYLESGRHYIRFVTGDYSGGTYAFRLIKK
ncbi:MAG: hypothetical protein KC422_09620 [Trueperaceae bacterium]|nr:hypothetical protein [Trueperaceae bacterium]